jgi:hypothetical protein
LKIHQTKIKPSSIANKAFEAKCIEISTIDKDLVFTGGQDLSYAIPPSKDNKDFIRLKSLEVLGRLEC